MPLTVSFTTSPCFRPNSAAVFGLMSAALSQTSFVIGSGSSCSHGFIANRPSKTE